MHISKIEPEFLGVLYSRYPYIQQHIEQIKPDIYRIGNDFCCLSGRTAGEMVFGSGATMHEALEDWEINIIKNG